MKFTQDTKYLLRCLLMYHLAKVKKYSCLAALGWAEASREDIYENLKTGCFAYRAWVDKQGDLSNLLASSHEFGQLRVTNIELHDLARGQRKGAQSYWSNFTQRVQLEVRLNEAYQLPCADEGLLRVLFAEAKARYSGLFMEFGESHLLEVIRDIEL